MKRLLFMSLFLLITSIRAQTNTQSFKGFTFSELVNILNNPPGKKQLDSILLEHGYSFENKGSVFSPNVNGPVKNAHTLRYKRGTFRVIISYYNNAAYLISYFASSSEELNRLTDEIKEQNVTLVKVPNSETTLYGEYQQYRLNVYNGERKVLSVANIAIYSAKHLMPF